MTNSLQDKAFHKSGQRIRSLREKAQMTQEELSFAANIDQSTLSKLERIGPQVVSWQKLESVARALRCVVEVSFVPSDLSAVPRANEHPQ